MEGESQIAPVEQIDYLRKEDLVVDGSIQEVAQWVGSENWSSWIFIPRNGYFPDRL